jgi:hypothetical protein
VVAIFLDVHPGGEKAAQGFVFLVRRGIEIIEKLVEIEKTVAWYQVHNKFLRKWFASGRHY